MKGLITTLFLICSTLSFGQLSKDYVENWIRGCDSETDFELLDRLYIVEGVIVDKNYAEGELMKLDANNRFLYIDYVFSDSIETTFFKPNLLVVVVGTTPKLKRNERQEKLLEVQSKFSDEYTVPYHLQNPHDPVLIINDERIAPKKSKELIERLDPKKVNRVLHVNHAPGALYGRNAKNGVVKIWTR